MQKIYVLGSDIRCVKYVKTRDFLQCLFFRLRFCHYTEKYGYDSANTRKNTDQKILHFGIFYAVIRKR